MCHFILGHRDLLLDLPAGFWLNFLSFSELQFWWHFLPRHPIKERKENNIQGTPSLQSWSGDSKEAAGGSTTPTLLTRPFTGGWGLYPTPHSPLRKQMQHFGPSQVSFAELQMMLSQIREAWTLGCHTLPRERVFRQEPSISWGTSVTQISRAPITSSSLFHRHLDSLLTIKWLNGLFVCAPFPRARRETSVKAKKVAEIHGITTQIKKIQR